MRHKCLIAASMMSLCFASHTIFADDSLQDDANANPNAAYVTALPGEETQYAAPGPNAGYVPPPASANLASMPASGYLEAQESSPPIAVPKLALPAASAANSTSGPYRLSHLLGLNDNSPLQIDGFLSAGIAGNSAQDAYEIPNHGAVSNEGDFNALSLVGVQISAMLYKGLSLVGQISVNGDASNGNKAYSINLDKGYAQYMPSANCVFRLGRIQLPTFMYSATQQVAYTYPWLVLPNEVYRIVPITNANGFDSIFSYPIAATNWSVSAEPFIANTSSEYDLYLSSLPNDSASVPTGNFDEDLLAGITAEASNNYFTFHSTYAYLSLTGKVTLPNGNLITLMNDQHDYFYSAGMKLDYKGLLVASEFAHRATASPLASLSGVYGMVGYQVYRFLPNFTYGTLWTTNANSLHLPQQDPTTAPNATELAEDQDSLTGGLDYYLNRNVALKASVADIRPLNGTSGLFNTVEPSQLKSNNWLYLVGVNAIF